MEKLTARSLWLCTIAALFAGLIVCFGRQNCPSKTYNLRFITANGSYHGIGLAVAQIQVASSHMNAWRTLQKVRY